MKNLIDGLKDLAREAILKAYPQLSCSVAEILEVASSTGGHFGHYQCNSALKMAKILNEKPRDVATKIASFFSREFEGQLMILPLEIAGPGFINIVIDPLFLARQIELVVSDPRVGVDKALTPRRVIVEFSSPNVAKEMHVGHIRSTIIGDSISRVMEFLGHDVLRLNHIGDWGTQFGMLIAHLEEKHPTIFLGEERADLTTLMHWYKESKVRFDQDADFKKRAQQQVVALQSGDLSARKAWQIICEISRKGFQEIYDLLDVKIVERGESFYNEELPGIITELEEKRLITVSDGAKCIFMEGFLGREGEPLPMIVQKSDGGYNYDTTDMAALKQRALQEKADRIIYLTDLGQALHFQMVFKAGELAGYYDPKKVQVEHAAFGVVLGPDGKKFKTRSGETEKLIDLLQTAIDKAKALLVEKGAHLGPEELDDTARILGVDSVKYADLSCHRTKDYLFSYDRMLRFEGNTAAFLLYAYVRVQGIKRKIGKDLDRLIGRGSIVLTHLSEISLALQIRQFGEAIAHVDKELLPNRLTDYLYELAEKFHGFFRDCRVEGDPMEESRLLLCEACGKVLKKGLDLLGLKVLEKM